MQLKASGRQRDQSPSREPQSITEEGAIIKLNKKKGPLLHDLGMTLRKKTRLGTPLTNERAKGSQMGGGHVSIQRNSAPVRFEGN